MVQPATIDVSKEKFHERLQSPKTRSIIRPPSDVMTNVGVFEAGRLAQLVERMPYKH
jgi:hypothetical protein